MLSFGRCRKVQANAACLPRDQHLSGEALDLGAWGQGAREEVGGLVCGDWEVWM